jgi:cytochrome c biogenesis protein CcmG/thiol:disulfide interchange protein DsbE
LPLEAFIKPLEQDMNTKYRIIILAVTILIIFAFFLKVLSSNKVYQPNQMIGKKIPEFILEDLFDKKIKINSKELLDKDFVVINIWASWCIPCRIEHPLLMNLKKNNQISIIGINYKDERINAKNFLKKYGNPYQSVGVDNNGEVSIQLGAYGVPETYVFNKGKIIFKNIGPINEDVVAKILQLKK